MFHGAGQTNMNWLQTPDGRMGWADYFVSQGFCVVLAEQPSRGRSAYHPAAEGPRTFHPLQIVRQRFTTDEGPWPQAKKHTQWPDNGGDWEDPTFRQFAAAQVEYLPSNKRSQELVLAAGKELLELLGPCILLTHSQAGPFGWLLADACPEKVKAVIALEPTAPPFSVDQSSPKAKNYGLADLPLHFEPPVQSPEDFRLRLLPSQGEGLHAGWVLDEERSLPRLKMPILLVTSEASYHAQFDHLLSYVMDQLGVWHDFVRLEDVGIRGNSHMMMLEKNNLEIADYLINWISNKGL
jgi:pimeloyl-ACP methyl ester carboxylesterase